VPSFAGETVVDLPIPCTFDFNVAATKYFYGLQDGVIPLCLMFSGTVFYAKGGGGLQVAPISWNKEARFKLPVQIWRHVIEAFTQTPHGFVPARRVERLYQYKVEMVFRLGNKRSKSCSWHKRVVR
jgi:hypothetical protein